MEKGLIHIYCGDGKGKTTAALGLALRASGRDIKVVIVRFLKGSFSGELNALKKLTNITVICGSLPSAFTWQMNDEQKLLMIDEHNRIFKEAVGLCQSEEKMLLIMDEIVGALDKKFIDRNLVISFLENKPEKLEVVMTGRNPDEKICEMADYISEIKKVKHPFDKGINARDGIEM